MKKNKEKEFDASEINPYEVDKLAKVPAWFIVLFLKYWAAAAAIFFIGMSVDVVDFSTLTTDDPYSVMAQSLVLILLFAVYLALFENYIVRPIVKLMYNRRKNTFRYNMINVKGFKSFLLNLLYMFPVSFVLFFITILLSNYHLILDPFGTSGGVGIEPFTYGLCFIFVDTICLLIKNLIIMFAQRIQYKRQLQGE